MKKLDKNQKIAIVSLAVFVVFMIAFFALSSLVQGGIVPDPVLSQRVQGIVLLVMFLPLFSAMFFGARYLRSRGFYRVAKNLTFVSVALFIFSIVQALLSLLGTYGA